MRYAISYVSTAAANIDKESIKSLFKFSAESNNARDITGLLLCSEGNFFQLIEGEEEIIKGLFRLIEVDSRHNNIIKFLEKPIHLGSYDGYICEVVSEKTRYNGSKLKDYLHYIEVLDPESRKAIKKVIQAMII